jgi:hypothetical protein
MPNAFLNVASSSVIRGLVQMLSVALLLAVAAAPPALAVAPTPRWAIESKAYPTQLTNGSAGELLVLATNTGGSPTNGEAVTITDTLPTGITATSAEIFDEPGGTTGTCKTASSTVECTYALPVPGSDTSGLWVQIHVSVESGTGGANTATVAGAGAGTASATEPVTVSAREPSFDFNGPFNSRAFAINGALDTQAGAHPGVATTEFAVNSVANPVESGNVLPTGGGLKDVAVDLPAGFVGNPQAAPTCPQYLIEPPSSGRACPVASVIGSVALALQSAQWKYSVFPVTGGEVVGPLFNVPPEHGHPAQFAFTFAHVEATLYANLVHTAAGYVVRVSSPSISRSLPVTGVKVTVFGDPAVQDGGAAPSRAFFTNPTDCAATAAEPPKTTIHIDSWQSPASLPPGSDGATDLAEADFSAPQWVNAVSEAPPVTGCENLRFEPTLSFAPEPEHRQADEPAGYESVVRVPQNEDPNGLATPALKTAVVTLPAGVAISPAAADGLLGCQATGPEGIELGSSKPGHCPAASTVGSVRVLTPLLKEELEGSVFVAQPSCGGPRQAACTEEAAETGGVFALYLEVGNERYGVHLKLKGKVEVGGSGQHSRETGLQPGQVRTTFAEAPQQPFSELTLRFKNGPRAPLANPQTCGSFQAASELEPWSHQPAPGEAQGTPNATPLSPAFAIGGGCGGGFAPSFSAGTINPQAGGYSPFTLTFSRHDGEQDLSGLTVGMPEGLLGKIAGFAQCGEAQATAGTCPAASRIGTATSAAGSGSSPLWQSGPVYLTGPYKGAPFGLSVAVPAKAGPYNLGTIVVRAAIHVDPHTAAITVISDPLPQSVDGVPLRLRTVNVTVDREGFMFNPTSCEPTQVGATLTSSNGTSVPVTSRFQAAGCQGLPFGPTFSATTAAGGNFHGASLDVKITQKPGEAAIRKVETQLPVALPSRLVTLQKACTDSQFAANPAGCPEGSFVGIAKAVSPVLNVPLTGPAILVSHGGAAFPDLDIILQGEGVTINLVGSTDIKKGITYSRFQAVPDAPISSFELNLRGGPGAVLAASKNLCALTKTTTTTRHITRRIHGRLKRLTVKSKHTVAEPLLMPTTITGQNGAVTQQNPKITVTGCPTAKRAKAKAKRTSNAHKRRHR